MHAGAHCRLDVYSSIAIATYASAEPILFSRPLSPYSSRQNRSIISRSISLDLSRVLRASRISYGRVASSLFVISIASSFFFDGRDSMISAANAKSKQSDISILKLHLNDATPVSLIALSCPLSLRRVYLSFFILLRVTLDQLIFSLREHT